MLFGFTLPPYWMRSFWAVSSPNMSVRMTTPVPVDVSPHGERVNHRLRPTVCLPITATPCGSAMPVSTALALPFFNPFFLIGYLIGIAFFGLFQAIFMANAGGAWDNAKKYIEDGNFGGKGSETHKAAVTGDTVGDPFKDTSSVAMNPIIKFTTLFGLLAVEIAVKMPDTLKHTLGAAIFVVALVFVYRSFYGMRIPVDGAKG